MPMLADAQEAHECNTVDAISAGTSDLARAPAAARPDMAFSTGLSVRSELGYSTCQLHKPATGSVWLEAVRSELIVLTKIQNPKNGMLYTAAVSRPGRRWGATARPCTTIAHGLARTAWTARQAVWTAPQVRCICSGLKTGLVAPSTRSPPRAVTCNHGASDEGQDHHFQQAQHDVPREAQQVQALRAQIRRPYSHAQEDAGKHACTQQGA